jgi:hypothetical protein
MPTSGSHQAVVVGKVKPVSVQISHDDKVKIVTGKPKTDIGHLPGLSGSTRGRGGWMGSSGEGTRKEVEWVLKAEEGAQVTITVSSERAGTDTADIVLSS